MARALSILLAMLLLNGCTNVFFQPYQGYLLTPTRVGLAYEDVDFNAKDGVRLHGWFLPAEGRAVGTVLFLHGNAENISTHLGSVYWLPKAHFNVFLIDYRGYGASEGAPTLPGAIDDADSALRTLVARKDIDPHRIVILGQSLGAAIAVYVAAHSEQRSYIRALVVDSSFASYRGIAREKLGGFWLTWPFQWPLSFTVNDDYSPIDAIPLVSPIPVLIIHDGADQIIPEHHATSLFAAAHEPKELWLLPDGGHIQTFNKPANRERFVRYLTRMLDGPGTTVDAGAWATYVPTLLAPLVGQRNKGVPNQ
jgi:fermentation-respiration switch protein FrsA (DUF1100 family)